MQVQVEEAGPCRAKVTFQVPGDEFQGEVQRALKRVASQTRLKGFRPGKVPLAMVERRLGDEVRRDTKSEFVRRALAQAVEENELNLLRHPHVEVDESPLEKDGAFDLEFEVVLRPEVELGQYTGLEVTSAPAEIEEEQVDQARKDLVERNSRPEPAGAEGLPEDGMALASMRMLHGEEAVLEREGLRVSPSNPPPGVEAEAFREAIVGAVEGAELELPLTFPEGFQPEELVGEQGTCAITLGQVFRIVPPEDGELWRAFEVDDEPSLRARLREELEAARDRQEQRRIEDALLQRIVEEHEFELPPDMIDEQVRSRTESLRSQMGSAGMEPEAVEEQLQARGDDLQKEATRSARVFFLMEAIAQKESLRVTDEDLRTELKAIAERNGVELEEVSKYYQQENLVNQLVMEILERKVRNFLVDSNQVVAGS